MNIRRRVRVRGSRGGRVRVRVLELSSTSSQFTDPIIILKSRNGI